MYYLEYFHAVGDNLLQNPMASIFKSIDTLFSSKKRCAHNINDSGWMFMEI